MSSGLPRLQAEGRTPSRRPSVSPDSEASSPPLATSASVASTPGPPALVTIVSRGPRGRGCRPRTSANLKTSPMSVTRRTPLRRKAASNTSSEPVSAPVCEAAALLAAAERPALMTMIGLVSATSRVADRLHVDHDGAGARVVTEVVDEIAPADVEHRAERDERAEPHALPQAPVEDRRQQRAALTQEGHASRVGHAGREGGVEPGERAH